MTDYILYDPAIWNTDPTGIFYSADLPLCDYLRRRGIPHYNEEELAKLDAMGALDKLCDADRETLFREARAAKAAK